MYIVLFFPALIHCLRYPLYIFRLYWFSSYSGESVVQALSFLYKLSLNSIDLIIPDVIQGDNLCLYLLTLIRFSGKCLLKLAQSTSSNFP